MAKRGGDWGSTVAAAWERLLPSSAAGGDERGFGRVTLTRRSWNPDGTPGGSFARLDTYPFAEPHEGADYLARAFGLAEGSSEASELRKWAATVLEVWDAARSVWGEEGERVPVAQPHAVVAVAHAACSAAAVAASFSRWIEEEGRAERPGIGAWWDMPEGVAWSVVEGGPTSDGEIPRLLPWRMRKLLDSLGGPHGLSDCVDAGRTLINLAIKRAAKLGEIPTPGSAAWEEARAMLEIGAVRVAVADLAWRARRTRSQVGISALNAVDPKEALALAESGLARRWGGRAASTLASAFDLPPLTALPDAWVADVDGNMVEGFDRPPDATAEAVEGILDGAVATASAALDMAAFAILNRSRRSLQLHRLLGLSANGCGGEWEAVPAFAWRPRTGVDAASVGTLMAEAERAARAASTLAAGDPSPSYGEAIAGIGADAVVALSNAGMFGPECDDALRIAVSGKGDRSKARRTLSRVAGKRIRAALAEAGAEAITGLVGEQAVAKALREKARSRNASGKGDTLARWLEVYEDGGVLPSFLAEAAGIGEAEVREAMRKGMQAEAGRLLSEGGEYARSALSRAMVGDGDPMQALASLVALAAQTDPLPRAALRVAAVPPPEVWLLYGCAVAAERNAAPSRKEGAVLGASSPAMWLANAIRGCEGLPPSDANPRHMAPVMDALGRS